jgi:hypothetical protein
LPAGRCALDFESGSRYHRPLSPVGSLAKPGGIDFLVGAKHTGSRQKHWRSLRPAVNQRQRRDTMRPPQ